MSARTVGASAPFECYAARGVSLAWLKRTVFTSNQHSDVEIAASLQPFTKVLETFPLFVHSVLSAEDHEKRYFVRTNLVTGAQSFHILRLLTTANA